MRLKTLLTAGVATTIAAAAPAFARETTSASAMPVAAPVGAGDGQAVGSAPAASDAQGQPQTDDIVVTARQREERLKDVPIAVTAITGDRLKELQVNTVKDIASYTPGLNINSDSVGRAFVSIRGIGTTLIDTVQPGVGIFIDGVYQPNTSYLNSPIVDVARIEVLRGPQGTLFGNNTLGGAINVVTRQPGNDWTGRFDATAAGTDSYYSVSGSVSGPIARDVLSFRIGASYHVQDGFQENILAHGSQNPLEQQSINGTLRFTPASWATFTLNGNYDRVTGGNTPYLGAAGPTDYTLNGPTNQLSVAAITYKGVNLKSEFDVASLNTKIILVTAYDRRDVVTSGDGDFGPVDFIRSSGSSRLETKTAELRFDTHLSDNVSTLIGLFANRSTVDTASLTSIIPLGVTVPATTRSQNDQRAVFGTVFFKFGTFDLAVGGRYDHQRLLASQTGPAYTAPEYRKDQFQPRATLTAHWTPDFMTYASVAKGIRGGGQNGPGTTAALALYKGDSVWTYEVGTKVSHGGLSVNADVFYNDYRDFIGQNTLAPKVGGGFVAVNLNTGKVKSYGAELEVHWRITPNWRIDVGGAYVHARITDDSEYRAATGGIPVSTDRIIFTPDYNFNASTTYTVPIDAKALVFDAGIFGKGSRIGSTLDPTVAPRLAPYTITNASVTMRFASGFSIGVFGTNLFNTKFIESYIDKSALVKAGLGAIAQNLAIQGDRRRYGVRASFKF
ncbi:TonB-dependent receptor [Sphingomonas sp. AR_OL41]|uniref:TonB-dependent receptor n=1 Tax=Sphingomonas sp. AR_OL41 TaxID=3042729 RepID=UPI002480D477|nr:TonB-dependent receptor [Sphingomonas sp. AR_OL41]MDH7975886.1 TonB-dependent receptor [Sphingomonas sp. AR_OL41]